MRKNYGYDSYRGRSPLRSVLKWIIALLTAVLVLTVAALLWLQQFMVYSSEGGRLVFPWTEQNAPSASPSAEWESPAVSPTVVVVTPEAPAPGNTSTPPCCPGRPFPTALRRTGWREAGRRQALLI